MRHNVNNVLIALSLLFISAIFFGCDSEDGLVIAKVGSDKIYAKDIDEIYARNPKRFQSFEDEYNNRRMITDSLAVQQLLIQEAYRKNIDDVEEVGRIVLANSDGFLLDALYQKEILDKVNVTEDDIKDFYSKLEFKVHAFHILVENQDTAMMLIDSLKKGGNFENLAVNYSIDPQAKTTRGDLGFFIWGQMDPDFQEQVFKLEPGQISEPFETRHGWHIVKMIERAPNELRGTYGKMKEQIEASLTGAKSRVLLTDYGNILKENFPITIDTITCQYLINKKKSLYPPSILESLPKNDFDLAQLDRHEKDLIFATWEGGQMTLGQYLTMIKRLQPSQKPNFDEYARLADFVFQMKYQDILKIVARKNGLENDPIYENKVEKFKELTMADIMQNDSIPIPPPPDDGQLRQYYEQNQKEFSIPPKAYIYEILFNDYETANTYAGKIGNLDRFKTMAKKFTERSAQRASGGDMGWIDARSYPKYFEEAEKSKIGDIRGPIQIGSKYALIYIADKRDEEVKDFLMVKTEILGKLDKSNKQTAFENWIEQQKSRTEIKIYENNIRASINKGLYDSETGGGN
ncbi:MAG: peptidylprolyl isomerase [Candidatus Zixiibacteriota bacterium]